MLTSVSKQVVRAIGSLLALSHGPQDLGGSHQQNVFDGVAPHDVDKVIKGQLGVLDQVEHGDEELAVLGENVERAEESTEEGPPCLETTRKCSFTGGGSSEWGFRHPDDSAS
jgi:hypothetical protein